jgi:hypothetical protein
MSWRFRKRVKVIPGVYLNLSRKGISTTIGPRGLSLNFNSTGTYLNTGIPGTGFSNRSRLTGGASNSVSPSQLQKIEDELKELLAQVDDGTEKLRSKSITQLSSEGLVALKQTIIAAHNEHSEITNLVKQQGDIKAAKQTKVTKLEKSLFRFLFKKKVARLNDEVALLNEELEELDKQLQLSTVDLKIANDGTFTQLYETVAKGYRLLTNCTRIWDVTTTKDINQVERRTIAKSEVNRVEVKGSIEHSDLIQADKVPMKLENKNGGDLYFYPGFLIIHESKFDFAIMDYSEINVSFQGTHFISNDAVSADSKQVGTTWYKTNKDGSPDKRFKGNYQMPIALHGEISFTSPTGLNERYMVSNYEYGKLFVEALNEYISAIKVASEMFKEFEDEGDE